jgi:hypothetical protein
MDGTRWSDGLGTQPSWPSNPGPNDLQLLRDTGYVFSPSGFVTDLTGPAGTTAPVSACIRGIQSQTGNNKRTEPFIVPFNGNVISPGPDFDSNQISEGIIWTLSPGYYRTGCSVTAVGKNGYVDISIIAVDDLSQTVVSKNTIGPHYNYWQWQHCLGYARLRTAGRIYVLCTFTDSDPSSYMIFDPFSRFWAVYLGT